MMVNKLADIKRRNDNDCLFREDVDWLIEKAEKIHVYEKRTGKTLQRPLSKRGNERLQS